MRKKLEIKCAFPFQVSNAAELLEYCIVEKRKFQKLFLKMKNRCVLKKKSIVNYFEFGILC